MKGLFALHTNGRKVKTVKGLFVHHTNGRQVNTIDDLRKSRGLHSLSANRHGLYIYRSMPAGVAQSRHAFVGGTLSMWAR